MHLELLSDRLVGVHNVVIETFDAETLQRLSRERGHNLVTTVGRELLTSFLNGDAPTHITHWAWGTGSTAAAAGDTALVTEVLRDLISQRIKNSATLTVKHYIPKNEGNGNTLREAGLFTADVGGTLYARYVLSSPIVKTSSIFVVGSWELTVTAA